MSKRNRQLPAGSIFLFVGSVYNVADNCVVALETKIRMPLIMSRQSNGIDASAIRSTNY